MNSKPELGCKLPFELENPIDVLIIKCCIKVNKRLDKNKITPNQLTTIGLIAGLISGILVLKKYFFIGGIFFLISYFFDCLDGNFARMYNKCTRFGDLYDHIVDLIKCVIIFIAIIFNNSLSIANRLFFVFFIYGLMLTLTAFHLACQEKIQKHDSSVLKFLVNVFKPNDNSIKWSRYFGCGTWYGIITFYFLFLEYFYNHFLQKYLEFQHIFYLFSRYLFEIKLGISSSINQ